MLAGLCYGTMILCIAIGLFIPPILRPRSEKFSAPRIAAVLAACVLIAGGLWYAIDLGRLYERSTQFGRVFGWGKNISHLMTGYHGLLVILGLVLAGLLLYRACCKEKIGLLFSSLCGLGACVAGGAVLYLTFPREGDEGLIVYLLLEIGFLFSLLCLLGMSLLALVMAIRYDRRKVSGLVCMNCRYDLTGNVSGICPECGTPLHSEARALLAMPAVREAAPCPTASTRTGTVAKLLVLYGIVNVFLVLIRHSLFYLITQLLPQPISYYHMCITLPALVPWWINLAAAVLLVVGAISLAWRQKWGPVVCKVWCALSIALTLVDIGGVLTGQSLLGLRVSQESLVRIAAVKAVWGIAVPILLLVWLARRQAKTESGELESAKRGEE